MLWDLASRHARQPCRGTAYVEDGYMSIAWNDRVPDEPDWERMERDAVAVLLRLGGQLEDHGQRGDS